MTLSKILIVTKDLSLKGGITNFFRIFFNRINNSFFIVEYFIQGERNINYERNNYYILRYISYILYLIYDIIRFIIKMCDKDIKIIHFNPSFTLVPMIRDSLFIFIAWVFNKKIIVFFHGWEKWCYNFIYNNLLLREIFKLNLNMVDHIIVLSEDFKKDLLNIGYENITVLKTMFDGDIYRKYDVIEKENLEFVYLGRLQKEKGIFEILEAINLLKKKNIEIKMNFIGWFYDNETEIKFNKLLKKYHLKKNCSLLGYLEGEEKVIALQNSDVFVFPSYREGCPTSVIEAMAAGLFIIATNVGSIPEIIENGVNGFIVERKNSIDLYNKILETLKLDNITCYKKTNRKKAFDLYEANVIIEKIVNIYRNMIKMK